MGQQIISLQPSTSNLTPGQQFTVDISHEVIREATEIAAVVLSIQFFYKGSELRFDSVDYPSSSFVEASLAPETGDSINADEQTETDKRRTIIFPDLSLSTDKSYPDDKTVIARLTFTVLDEFDGSVISVKIPNESAQSYNNAPTSVFEPKTVSLNLLQVNQLPVITSGDAVSVAENTLAVTTITATDGDNDPLSFSISGGQDQALFNINETTGALSFKAAPDFENPVDITGNNEYLVQVAVGDGSGTVTQNLKVTVTDINDTSVNEPPTVNNPITDQTATEDNLFNFVLPANTFTDPDGGQLTLTASLDNGSALPGWLVFNSATRRFSGTPTNDADAGIFNVKVTATDLGNLSVSDTFALNVLAVNDTPVVANPIVDQTAKQDEVFTFLLPANTFTDEENAPLTLTATLVNGSALPGWLAFNSATRTFSGTPANKDVGALTVKVTASDGNTATDDVFGITIEPSSPTVTNNIRAVARGNLFFIELTNGTPVASVKYQNRLFESGTFGNWQILEAETINGINQILWQNPDSGEIGIWNADANWNWVSSDVFAASSINTLEAEIDFQVDINGDGQLGDNLVSIENVGSIELLQGIFDFYHVQTADGLTNPIKFQGQPFENNFGNWQALAAETVEGINQVLWENLDTGSIGVWNADANWNWISSDVFAPGSPDAVAQASIFGVDIGGTALV